ncbi:MAG: GNAT family N-acetyltransferase [Bacteroidales bacterium]
MKIRKYKEADCKEIMKLFRNTVHAINAKDYNQKQLDAWAPIELNSMAWHQSLVEHYTIIVEHKEIIVGFGDLDAIGYLDRLYVHKEYQNQGIASTILSEFEKYSLHHNLHELTTHASITAKPFFIKKGFTLMAEQQVQRKEETLTNFVMRKTLVELSSI